MARFGDYLDLAETEVRRRLIRNKNEPLGSDNEKGWTPRWCPLCLINYLDIEFSLQTRCKVDFTHHN